MHSLLRRQLRRYLADPLSIPEEWRGFVQAVNEAYREFDADRGMLERSLELSSQELLEANLEMRTIFKAIPDLLFRIDYEGTILECAAGGASEFFRNPRELIGKRIQDVHSIDTADQFLAAMKSVRKTGAMAVIEYCLLTGNGNQCFEARLMPLLKDQMIAIVRNITERKEWQQALVEATERYRSIFQNAVNGIFQISIGGRLIRVNPAFADALGYDSPTEVLDKITNFGSQVFVKQERYLELLHLLEDGGVVREFEAQFFRKDGKVSWITINARAVRDPQGKISYLEGTALDITERKMFESRLFQRQKMDAIGTLAGGVAHDFNNLLSPVIGYTEMALNKIPHETRLRTNLEQVLKSAYRAKDLVSQILAFSRQAEQEQRPIQLSSVVQEVLGIIRSSFPSTIEILQKIAPGAGSGMVMADSTQMHQVIMNLCANAGHAMREKGGLLEVSLTNEEVDPIATRLQKGLVPGSYLRLSVRDSGHGMDPEIIKRIFDPYFTTKSAGEGTGLGLAVVYSIVKNHKGVITAYSEPGQGSTFHVYLPRLETDAVAAAIACAPLPTGSGRILVVDDDEAIVELEKQMLEELGYEVDAKHSSIEALETFRAHPDRFDLVFTDQTMPGLTGLELARQMLLIRLDIPIILCTGLSDRIAACAPESGVRTVLSKPILLNQLAETIHKILCDKRPEKIR